MSKIDRRNFLRLSGSALIGITVGGVALRANGQEKLSEDDPTAQALKYLEVSVTEGQFCENCLYIQGQDGSDWRPCGIFPGKVVAAKGWCAAWMKKA